MGHFTNAFVLAVDFRFINCVFIIICSLCDPGKVSMADTEYVDLTIEKN